MLLCALLNVAGWGLSAAGWLNRTGYLALLGLTCGGAVWWWMKRHPRLVSGFRGARLRRRFRRAFPLAFALVAGLALAGGVLHAPSNYDGLAYRTPRVLHWLAEGQWHWIHTDFHRLNTRGCGIEWVTAPLLSLTGTDRFLFLISAVSFLLLPGLCYSLLVQLGVRKRVAWHWMWVLPTGYCFVLQAGSIANDLFGAALAMAAVDYALKAGRTRSARAGWLAMLAAALMTSGKGFNLLLLLPWGLAMLPATGALLRRPVATFLVGVAALTASLVPTAMLNQHYCGDWKGTNVEPVNLGTGDPLLHVGANAGLVTLHNFAPTFFPLAGAWNRWMDQVIPATLAAKLRIHFEDAGARFQLGEMQMEEVAGLGFGVSVLLLTVLVQRPRLRWSAAREWPARWLRPACLVPLSAWAVALYFFTQAGLGCPARYLAPSYVLMVAPLLCSARAGQLLKRGWWRGLVGLSFALAVLLLVVTPSRPLWPAQTVLRALGAGDDSTGWRRRAWTVYSVYGTRPDGFAPVREMLPPGIENLGLVTFDDPETSLWRPFGARRIVHVTRTDDAGSVRRQGIEYVLVSEYILEVHQQRTLAEWLARFDGEVVGSLDLSLRATRGPTRWHLVRLRPARPDVAGRAG